MSSEIWQSFAVDSVALYLTAIFGLIALFSLIYSIVTIRRFEFKDEYYVMFLILVGTGIAFLYGRNLILLFTFWELNTFAVWRLVGYYRDDWNVDYAERIFLINFFAAVLMLVGIGIIYSHTWTFDLNSLKGASVPGIASYLILIGILTKSATIPLHIWLPFAYRSAPIPVVALLAGISENLGLVIFLRLFRETLTMPPSFYYVVAIIAVCSIIVGGGVALITNRIRSIYAYSTISQLGFILLGLAVGGFYGITGALLYILAHALAKPGILYSLGIVEERTKAIEIGGIGFGKELPSLGPIFAILCGSIIGLPPFIGFFGKLGIILATIKVNIPLASIAIGGAVITLLYLVRLYNGIFKGPSKIKIQSGPDGLIYLAAVLAFISIIAALLLFFPIDIFSGGIL
ncbi:MAG TPA: hypothetical protein EYP58_05325 [bacterium (Candidatus Stahlbacteria)]|nr:hypothetical protein [Candidatus Stahlbacteria bacterium]